MIHRLKDRWGVESMRDVVLILIVFSLTGCSILFVKDPIFALLGLQPGSALWIRLLVAIALYQVLLLFFGALLGQGRFFWEKEKRLGRLLLRPFRKRSLS